MKKCTLHVCASWAIVTTCCCTTVLPLENCHFAVNTFRSLYLAGHSATKGLNTGIHTVSELSIHEGVPCTVLALLCPAYTHTHTTSHPCTHCTYTCTHSHHMQAGPYHATAAHSEPPSPLNCTAMHSTLPPPSCIHHNESNLRKVERYRNRMQQPNATP